GPWLVLLCWSVSWWLTQAGSRSAVWLSWPSWTTWSLLARAAPGPTVRAWGRPGWHGRPNCHRSGDVHVQTSTTIRSSRGARKDRAGDQDISHRAPRADSGPRPR